MISIPPETLIVLIIIVLLLIGFAWYNSESIGNSIASAFGIDTKWCESDPNKKCFKNCEVWTEIDKNADFYCQKEFGDGWVYDNEKGQANCTAGFGKAKCVSKEEEKNKKYFNNCEVWTEIDKKGNFYCQNDLGDGWVYTGEKNKSGCTEGFGKGKCEFKESEKNKKFMKECDVLGQIDQKGDQWCANDFGKGWGYSGEKEQTTCVIGQRGKCIKDESKYTLEPENKNIAEKVVEAVQTAVQKVDDVLGGTMDTNWCGSDPAKKCFNNCEVWDNIDGNADYFCKNDHGEGWVYTGEKGQGDCTVGLGKGKCEFKENEKGKNYFKNCEIWSAIDNKGNYWCKNDHGDGWIYNNEKVQTNCPSGQGRGKCEFKESEKNKKYFNGCVIWTEIDNNGNYFCQNDHGPGWVYTGEKEEANCSSGQGKGKCEFKESEKEVKYMKNCAAWSSIDPNGTQWCKDDFKNEGLWTYIGKEQGGCPLGQGRGKCKKDIPPPFTPNWQPIKSSMNDKCLEIEGGFGANGTKAQMWDCHGGENQKWMYDIERGGYLTVASSGKCLGVDGGRTEKGTKVLQWECDGSDNQKWVIDDRRRLKPKHSQNKCLDISRGSNNNGAEMILWDCNDEENQKWYL